MQFTVFWIIYRYWKQVKDRTCLRTAIPAIPNFWINFCFPVIMEIVAKLKAKELVMKHN